VLLREAEALGDSKARGGEAGEAASGATRSDEVHPGVQCDGCDQFPITGVGQCCSVACSGGRALTYLKPTYRAVRLSGSAVLGSPDQGRDFRGAGPCYTSKVQQDYDLCSRCRQQPQAERAAPFARRQGRTRGQEDNGPALVKWCARPPVVPVTNTAWSMEGDPDSVKWCRWVPRWHPARTHMKPASHFKNCRVWKHFTGEDPTDQSSDNTGGHIIRSDKPPLYFQHGDQ
jgi:hypothetical protein